MNMSKLILPTKSGDLNQEDEAAKLFERLKELDGLKRMVFGTRVLIAKYAPDKLGSGVLVKSELSKKEDKYQGKTGLVIKKGHLAFRGDDTYFGKDNVDVGDWVWFDYSDGMDFDIMEKGKYGAEAEIRCKIIEDKNIIGVIPRPDLIY